MARVFRACPHGMGSDLRDDLWLPDGRLILSCAERMPIFGKGG
jgi:hypothetical protein